MQDGIIQGGGADISLWLNHLFTIVWVESGTEWYMADFYKSLFD